MAAIIATWLSTLTVGTANVPGGGTGAGANVILTDSGTAVTLSNGIVSIVISKANATISTINYTHSTGSGTVTTQMLAGGTNGGQLYWDYGSFGDYPMYTYALVADPLHPTGTRAVGDYAEITLTRTGTNGNSSTAEIHFSMLRGSPGFYLTPIFIHGSADPVQAFGVARSNIYAGSIFNWMSVDAARDRQMPISAASVNIGVYGAPKEVTLWTGDVYQGRYEDKYKYTADMSLQTAWGWSSVTTTNPAFTGSNVGLWNVIASAECYNGGPLKRNLMCHNGTTILNVFQGNYYGVGTDNTFTAGELWSKAYGPYFIYCNSIPTSATNAASTLYADAQAQAAAERGAWPYSWFSNTSYTPAAGRGTVTGKMVINDSGNPNASAANMWVGVVQQPVTSENSYDFQQWAKPYHFWVKTDAGGNFTIPNVIAGTNYTLYAFGPGAAGTFQSQAQTGGTAPMNLTTAATPFAVTVTGGATTALGNVTWTAARVGATVFEIGTPDRYSYEFRHGDDYWVSDVGPDVNSPSPNWGKFLDYPVDFPNGVNYTVGTSRWSTDWNYVQPVVLDNTGNFVSSASTINFNLPAAPGTGAGTTSLFIALSSDYQGPLAVSINGTILSSSTATATPNAIATTGYTPSYSSSDAQNDTTIREGPHGAYTDERITFSASLLKQGANTITLTMRKGGYFANHAMYDYLRLELAGYTPPAPASVAANAGNGRTLLTWPATPGATGYNVLRSTTPGSGYAAVATGVIGPVCGSGPANATYVDATAANGATYYYVVQSVNPTGTSANSVASAAVTPGAGAPATAPSAPTGLTSTAANGAVTLNWTASSGANFYTVKRSTLATNNGSGTYTVLGTIVLSNGVTGPTYTDSSVSNGTIYSYTVSATNAVGTGGDSTASGSVVPRAPAPTVAPASLTATALQNADAGNIQLTWPAVSGATGYILQTAASASGPYTFLTSLAPPAFTNYGLAANTTYYYQVATTNTGGTSAFVGASATTPPAAPANLAAAAGSSKVTLSWTAAAGATSYVVGRATVSGGAYTTLAAAATGTSFVDRTAVNGVTYYYVVAATGAGGTGSVSTEVSTTPVGAPSVVWTGATSSVWDTATANWTNGGTAALYADGNVAVFDDTATNRTANVSGTVMPYAALFNNANAFTLNATGLSGAATLSMNGTGTLNITGTNTFSGGTTISGGAVVINGGTANGQNGLGTGTISLQGGTLTMNSYTGSQSYCGNLTNPIDLPVGFTSLLQLVQYGSQSGAVTGAGTLTLQVNYIRGNVSGDWSGFTGQLNVLRTRTGTTVDDFRLGSNTGFGTAAINLGPYVQASTVLNAANSFTIGELTSTDATAQLAGIIYNNNTPGAYTATYLVGGRNTNATFAGSIVNGASPSITAITKTGMGTWTLSGACTYTGATAINGGTLRITGQVSNTAALTVANGAAVDLAGGRIAVAGPIINNGTVRLSGTAALGATGVFTNNGLLDLIDGPGGLSANLVNNGTVLDASSIAIKQAAFSGSNFVITVQGYSGHAYQLQRGDSLSTNSWSNVGSAQTGNNATLTLTDYSAPTTRAFYRVVVSMP